MISESAPTPGARQRDILHRSLGLLAAVLLACPVHAADFTWTGATSSDFSVSSNWSGAAPSPTGGGVAAPVAWRISVQNGTGNTLVYSAAQGYTVLSGGGSSRSLFIGNTSNGSMSITGGIFESTSTGADGMVNGAGSVALLSIDGGTYRKITGTGAASTFGVYYAGAGNSRGTLDINSGSFEVTTLDLQNSNGTSTLAAGLYESTVNLDGGTLSVGSIVRAATSTGIDAIMNFNGGTLQARADSTTFLAALGQFTANVQAGGAVVDTQTYNVTIAAPLVHDTALGATADGGLTKVGTGTLTMSGASTYTGGTFIKSGTLALGAGNDRLPTGTTVTLGDSTTNSNGVLKLDSRSQTLAGLLTAGTGTGNSVVNGNATAATLTLNIATSNSFGGTLGGTGTNENNFGLTKTGAGTLTLTGTNTYTGTTSIQAGTLQAGAASTVFGVNAVVTLGNVAGAVLDLNGFSQTIASLAGGGATGGNVTLGSATLTLGGTNASTTFAGSISGTGGLTKTGTGTFTLSGANTYTGLTTVSAGILSVASNTALGDVAGKTSVTTGGSLSLANGVKVTGETVGIVGPGSNSNGALQVAAGASAEWAGVVTIEATSARIGALAGGTLTISGGIQNGAATVLVISGASGTGTVVVSGTNNTYTGATQIIRGVLKVGSNNALPTGTTLDVDSLSTGGVADNATFDLNGFNQTVAVLQRGGSLADAGGSFITNNGATASTLTVTGGSTIYTGIIQNGNSVLNLTTGGTLTLQGANTYTGTTTVNSGTLKVGGVATASLASTSFVLNGGLFTVDNTGASNNNNDRLADTADITFKGGAFSYKGSDQAATNSNETVHDLTVSGGLKTLGVVFGGTNTATLNANQITRPAQGGVLLVNGANLGMDSTSTASVSRVIFTTAPELVGTTDALSTGINAGAKNTKIVPFLLGEATATTGGTGTATGTANTFMTYSATTGLRPLNLTDEFTLNAISGGANTRLTATTNTGTSTTINSLILEGASATISSGQTLTVSSGAILFSTGNTLGISGGTLAFGSHEGIITINSTGNTTISSVITGTGGITYSGSGILVLATQQNTYSGDTVLQVGTVIPQSNSTVTSGSVTSGPFGKGTVIFNGSSIRATSSNTITIANNVQIKADTTMLSSGVAANDKTLTFTGGVTLVGGNRAITQNSGANTVFSGSIGDGGNNLGLTIAGSGQSAVVLSGANTYTGPTQVNGSTLQVGSNGSGSTSTGAVTVASGATLAGSGTVQGATVMNAGSVLQPGDVTTGGTASTTVTSNNTLTFTAVNTALTVNDGAQIRLGVSSPTVAGNLISYSDGLFHYNGHDYSTALSLFSNESGALSTWNTSPGSVGNHDYIKLTNGTLSIGDRAGGAWGQGSVVVNGTLGTVTAGQVFNLIDWNGAAISGNFDVGSLTVVDASGNVIAGDLDLAALGAGFGWDVSAFKDYGILVVVAVPEPGRACLLLLGLIGFMLRRRR